MHKLTSFDSTQLLSNLEQFVSYNLNNLGILIRKNPTTTKMIGYGSALGAGLIVARQATTPLSSGIIGTVTGILLTTAAAVALKGIEIFVPPYHNMANHVFKSARCEAGELYYERDVPILSLESDDPFKAGVAHGYLCGSAINQLSKRFDLVLHTLARLPKADQILPELRDQIRKKIPEKYLEEIKGILEGYNRWAKENPWQFPKKLSLDELILTHLIPDSLHFNPTEFELVQPNEKFAIACTSIVDRKPNGDFVFARNMDWPSFGIAGAYSLVINRKYKNHLHNTVEVGVPGLVGTLTGMNDKGLSLAMNVCAGFTDSVRGMPAIIYNRSILESCESIEDLDKFIAQYSPLGPYHLTAADSQNAKSVHFYQAANDSHVIRQWSESSPLITLNCRYEPVPNCDIHHSKERQEQIDRFFQQDKPVEEVLNLPYVNNWLTTHRVIMEPKTGGFQVAFDNAFAGNIPLHKISTEKLF